MVRIYHARGARSLRPIWLCHEIGIPVEIERVDAEPGYRSSPEWLALSPADKVPAMIDGDLVLFESGAIVDYLLDRYGRGRLCPSPGSIEHARYRQWCWFSEATLSRPVGLYRLLRAGPDEGAELVEETRSGYLRALRAVESGLDGRDYLLGPEFSAADVMMGYSLALTEHLLPDDSPRVRAYLARLKGRQAFQRAMESA